MLPHGLTWVAVQAPLRFSTKTSLAFILRERLYIVCIPPPSSPAPSIFSISFDHSPVTILHFALTIHLSFLPYPFNIILNLKQKTSIQRYHISGIPL